DEAKQRIENPRGLDVAIVDLSWWGDYTLPQGATHRHNRGLKLLAAAGGGADNVLDAVTGSKTTITGYLLETPPYCRQCGSTITEKTLADWKTQPCPRQTKKKSTRRSPSRSMNIPMTVSRHTRNASSPFWSTLSSRRATR